MPGGLLEQSSYRSPKGNAEEVRKREKCKANHLHHHLFVREQVRAANERLGQRGFLLVANVFKSTFRTSPSQQTRNHTCFGGVPSANQAMAAFSTSRTHSGKRISSEQRRVLPSKETHSFENLKCPPHVPNLMFYQGTLRPSDFIHDVKLRIPTLGLSDRWLFLVTPHTTTRILWLLELSTWKTPCS